jgi:2',3'-cyclic-nucleotide 2'-phosphodiesterase/3'-nucleotidase
MAPKLTIFYTSDIHGFVFPTTHADDIIRPMGLLGMIPQFHKDGNTLILDCGDTIQGSPLTYYCRKQSLENPMISVMNAAGYDYVTLGNHDFNYGYEALAEYLNGLHARCVCANVKDKSSRLPLVPYVLHTLENGLRVGLTGIVTSWVNRWEKEETLAHFEITDPVTAAGEALAELRKQADFTVCLYHGGLEKDLETGRLLSDTDENIGCRICEELDFDLLLTGHQHIPMENRTYRGTHIAQTPANATHYLKVDAMEDGSIVSRLLPSDPNTAPSIAHDLEALKSDLDTWLDAPIGRLNMALWPGDKLSMALYGTPIANFFNQVQLEVSGADISCTSLPNDMRGFDSSVTVRDVVATYVYANTLVVLQVTGKVLKAALERCASYFDISPQGEVSISQDFLEP